MKRKNCLRVLSVLLLLALCIGFAPVQVQAADYIAANHTKSNGCPYYIMVNRQCNTVTIYTLDSNGYYTVPYKAMVCSTGRSGHATPAGTFSITGYKTRWNYMVDGSYGQYSSQFNGNYLFHSVCYYSTSSASLMTEEYNLLGNYASLGCVRLQVADAKWIYDNCTTGTMVTIYDGESPGPLGKPAKAIERIPDDDTSGWEPTDPASGNPWRVTVNTAVSGFSTGSGSVSGSGIYLKTNTATVTATPAAGSSFAGWYSEAGYLLSSNPSYSFKVTGNVTLEALFEIADYPLNVQASRSGTVTGAGRYRPGSSVTLSAHSASGAAFQGWYDAGAKLLGTSPNLTVVTKAERSLYYAVFDGDVYADVPAGAWYIDSVMLSREAGIFSGTSEITFNPESPLTRAMAVAVIARLAGYDYTEWLDADTAFTDISRDSYYYSAVCWAKANGVVSGTSETTFSPNHLVTREQFMAFLMRYAVNVCGMNPEEPELTAPDVDQISDYAVTSIKYAWGLGIIKGYEDGTLRPQGTLTRAEGAAFMVRMKNLLES